MKNLSLVLNAVLIVSVGVLFYLHFSTKSAVPKDSSQTNRVNPEGSFGGIVYINLDTLLNSYGYFLDLQKEFANRQSEVEAELNNRGRQYEASALDYQNKI